MTATLYRVHSRTGRTRLRGGRVWPATPADAKAELLPDDLLAILRTDPELIIKAVDAREAATIRRQLVTEAAEKVKALEVELAQAKKVAATLATDADSAEAAAPPPPVRETPIQDAVAKMAEYSRIQAQAQSQAKAVAGKR